MLRKSEDRMFLSIITPTYNRAYILSDCYQSLQAQTCRDFEWIIVDDGSTDETEKLVRSYIDDGCLDIKYIKQENGGKHRAHNTGVKQAVGEMIVCVDSDDRLTEDAVAVAKDYWASNGGDQYTGILAKRGDMKEKKAICSAWPEHLKSVKMFDLINRYGFSGDTVLFFRTDILKTNMFKEFTGEKFLPETNLYCEIDKLGEMLLLDRVLYLCEYLPDGLTAKFHQLLKENPNGAADTYYKQMCMAGTLKIKIKYALLTNIYKSLVMDSYELYWNYGRVLLAVTKIPAMIIKKHFLNKFKYT